MPRLCVSAAYPLTVFPASSVSRSPRPGIGSAKVIENAFNAGFQNLDRSQQAHQGSSACAATVVGSRAAGRRERRIVRLRARVELIGCLAPLLSEFAWPRDAVPAPWTGLAQAV